MFKKPLIWILFTLLSVAGIVFSIFHYPTVFPIVNLEIKMDRNSALEAAREIAQKYNLEGCGKRVRISQGTKDTVKRLYRRGDEVIEKGKEYSKVEKRPFGGCPRPGEDGFEKYFTTV